MGEQLFTIVTNDKGEPIPDVNSLFITSFMTTLRLGGKSILGFFKSLKNKIKKFFTSPTTESIVVSNNDFIPVNRKWWQGNTTKERKLILISALLIFMIFILTIVILFIALKIDNDKTVCRSSACIAAAGMLLQNIDESVDPCKDFYKYACGNWQQHHHIPDSLQNIDWFMEKRLSVKREIRDKLLDSQSTAYEPNAIYNMRTLFADCLNLEEIERRGMEPLRHLFNNLSISLKPNLFYHGESAINPELNITNMAAIFKTFAGFDFIVGVSVYPDPLNNSRNILGIMAPASYNPLPGEFQNKRWKQDKYYNAKDTSNNKKQPKKKDLIIRHKYMANIIKTVLTSGIDGTNDTTELPQHVIKNIEDAVEKIYEYEGKVYRLANTSISDVDFVMATVDELQNITDAYTQNYTENKIIWKDYFYILFQDKNITLKDIPTVQVQLSYVQNLVKLLTSTPTAIIEAALWWKIVDISVPYLTSSLRSLKRVYIEEISSGRSSMARSLVCASVTNQLMGMAVSYLFATPVYMRTAEDRVGQMIEDIKESFIDQVHQLEWMDDETRVSTLKKANAMKAYIAFPKWILMDGAIDKYYKGLKMKKYHYYNNVIQVLKLFASMNIQTLTSNENGKIEHWSSDPTDVNAFYSFQHNTITIPAAILQYPFYNTGLEVLNYGALGSIIGHEVVHGFDNVGRLYDSNGNFRPWWTNKTESEYVNKTKCFVDQYSKYHVEEVRSNVDGFLTLGENIADNGGIHKAVQGYRKLRDRVGSSLLEKLPGLEHFKPEQLLYLSYANLWCEKSTPIAIKMSLKEAHAPNKARIWGSISNSKIFAETWKCPLHTPMNPKSKCTLW